jgi:hypothetical protein
MVVKSLHGRRIMLALECKRKAVLDVLSLRSIIQLLWRVHKWCEAR